jgi:hypothetical protein
MATTRNEPTFRVLRREGDDDLREIGKVSVGDGGRLTLVGASGPFRGPLRDIIDAVNGLEEIRIKVPPPRGAEPGALYRRSVTRSEPDLLDALGAYLEQKYDLLLAAE